MASVFRRGRVWWLKYYLGKRVVQQSLGTKDRKLAEAKKREIEYLHATQRLNLPSRTPLAPLLESFFDHLRATRKKKSAQSDIGRLKMFFEACPVTDLAGGVNLYLYVGNNPGNRIDPLGLGPSWWKWLKRKLFGPPKPRPVGMQVPRGWGAFVAPRGFGETGGMPPGMAPRGLGETGGMPPGAVAGQGSPQQQARRALREALKRGTPKEAALRLAG